MPPEFKRPNWGMPMLNILSGAAQTGMASTAAHQNFWRGVVDFHGYAAASIGAEILVLIKEEQ